MNKKSKGPAPHQTPSVPQTNLEAVPFASRESVLARILLGEDTRILPYVGKVRFRFLGFEDYFLLKASTGNEAEFTARAIVAGYIQPKFLEEDVPALMQGDFRPVAVLGAPILERVPRISKDEVGK